MINHLIKSFCSSCFVGLTIQMLYFSYISFCIVACSTPSFAPLLSPPLSLRCAPDKGNEHPTTYRGTLAVRGACGALGGYHVGPTHLTTRISSRGEGLSLARGWWRSPQFPPTKTACTNLENLSSVAAAFYSCALPLSPLFTIAIVAVQRSA